MFPPAWGFYQWGILHISARLYSENPTEEMQLDFLQYIRSVFKHLPCPGCAYHALQYIEEYPPTVKSRDKVVEYFIDMHNSVNKRLGKKEFSHCEAIELIDSNFFKMKDWINISRAEVIRIEDHKLITDTLRQNTQNNTQNRINSILMWITTILLVLIFICGLICFRTCKIKLLY
jgi:hypothetical protein